jgi:hypothetical protein
MFLRCHRRQKNGKPHRYWSVVENRRLSSGQTAQRQVLYLGEINDSQQAAWRKTLEVFDEQRGEPRQMSLFPADRPIPAQALDAIAVDLSRLRLRRARRWGDGWLGLTLWRELGLEEFWDRRLGAERGAVPWSKVLSILAINRLCEPASEFAVHRRWFLNTALDQLLQVDFAAVDKDRLYRCLDRLLAHKDDLFPFLIGRWKTLFDAKFDVLLYDLTSTYFEGSCAQIPKALHGYSRDGRPDCRQVVIALVITSDGFPLAYEVLPGNTSDRTTLRPFLAKIEKMYGQARRVWLMDRGVPTEADLARMRSDGVGYLVGTPRHSLDKLEQALVDRPWREVHQGMRVKLLEQAGELYVLAQSGARRAKENAMRRRKLKTLVHGLNRLKRRCRERDRLLEKLAVLKKDAGRVAKFVTIRKPGPDEPVNRRTFVCRFEQAAWRRAVERDGRYLLRASIPLGPGERPSRPDAVALVHATGPGGRGLPHAQERPGPAPHLPPVGAARGGPHSGGLPGLLPVGDPAGQAATIGAGSDDTGGAGVSGGDPDGGRGDPHDRRAGAGVAALHRAGGPAGDAAGKAGADLAGPTPAAHPLPGTVRPSVLTVCPP